MSDPAAQTRKHRDDLMLQLERIRERYASELPDARIENLIRETEASIAFAERRIREAEGQ